ncbi:MAG: DUF4062 domain-containing protein [Clostridia bacterium]|nr:DUF4062 domain-containing protein [Clostridia bacterium]
MKLVFVSSTFKDMQFERDALNTYVAPLIDSALAPHGEAVYFGDLRWGVNTTELDSEESSKKVLDVCLDEIDNCKPYMIVLIGERYGWIPGAELLHTAAVTKGIDTPTDISVTQLEIEYGALLNPDYEGRILFYFRNLDKTGMTEAERRDYEAESDAHRAKLDALKARIAEIYPDAIRYYDAKWNPDTHAVEELMPLMELIREDLLRVFSADINRDNGIPWQERAMNAAHRYFMEHSRHYMDITPGSRAPLAGIYTDDYPLVTLIEGEEGSGKTAFISHEYREYYEADAEKVVIPFVKGLDTYSVHGASFFMVLLYAIEAKLGASHLEVDMNDDEPSTRAAIVERIKELLPSVTCPVVTVIDNCDYELYYDLFAGFYNSLPRTAEEYISEESVADNMLLLLAYSSRETAPVVVAPNFNFSETYIMDPLADEEKREFIKTVVRGRHKELSDVVIDRIVMKEESYLPLYIKLVVDRLLLLDSEDFANIRAMGDGMDNINKYMISLVDEMAEDLEDITEELVKEAAQRIDRDFVYRVLGLITSFPIWLSEGFIKQFFERHGWHFNALDFAITVKTLGSFIAYNTETSAYSVTNRRMLSAIRRHLKKEGFGDTPCHVFNYISTENNKKDWGEYRIKVASLLPDFKNLVELFYEYYDDADYLYEQLEWLINNTDNAADFVAELVQVNPKADFSYLLRRLPVRNTIGNESTVIVAFLLDLYERLKFRENDDGAAGYNSFVLTLMLRLIDSAIDGDRGVAIDVWLNEVCPAADKCSFYDEAINQHYLTGILISNAARELGLIDSLACPDGDPLARLELSEGYESTVLAGHILFAAANDVKDVDNERYADLLIGAINRYGGFNPTVEEERRAVGPDDYLTMSSAFSDLLLYYTDTDDYESAITLLNYFIDLTRAAAFYHGSHAIRMLRELLYMIDIAVADVEDVTLLRVRASLSRMISYRTHLMADKTETVFAYAKLLRIYNSIYETENSEIFAQILEAAAVEVWRLADSVSGSAMRLSQFLEYFNDVTDVLDFLERAEMEEEITDIVNAIEEIDFEDEEDKQGSTYEVFLLVRDYITCAYIGADKRRISSLEKRIKRLKKGNEFSLARDVYGFIIDFIESALE